MLAERARARLTEIAARVRTMHDSFSAPVAPLTGQGLAAINEARERLAKAADDLVEPTMSADQKLRASQHCANGARAKRNAADDMYLRTAAAERHASAIKSERGFRTRLPRRPLSNAS
jgi:hypothetical protein